ncbi:hypothetical protein [Ferdinandcohnia sp. Marseille-Q9671]
MFDVVPAIINIVFFVFIIYLISRVAQHFHNTKVKLNEIDQKLDEIKQLISEEKK